MLSSSSSEVVVPNESKKCHHPRTGKSSFWDHFLFSGSLNSLRAKKERRERERVVYKKWYTSNLSLNICLLMASSSIPLFFTEESFLFFSFFFRIVFELMNFDPQTWFFCFEVMKLQKFGFRISNSRNWNHIFRIHEFRIHLLFKILAYVIFLRMARNIFRRWRSSGFIRKFFRRLGHCCSRSWGCCSRG